MMPWERAANFAFSKLRNGLFWLKFSVVTVWAERGKSEPPVEANIGL